MTSDTSPSEQPKFLDVRVPVTFPTPAQLAGFHITWRDWNWVKMRIDKTPHTKTDYIQAMWGFGGIAVSALLGALGAHIQDSLPIWFRNVCFCIGVVTGVLSLAFWQIDRDFSSHRSGHTEETLAYMNECEPPHSTHEQRWAADE